MNKQESIFSGIGGAVVLIIILSLIYNSTTYPTITAYTATCSHLNLVNGICDAPSGPSIKRTFTVYTDTQKVIENTNNPLAGGSNVYNSCTIQDVNNWTCTTADGVSMLGFSNGNFIQDATNTALDNQAGIYYISGWSWWMMDFGFTSFGAN